MQTVHVLTPGVFVYETDGVTTELTLQAMETKLC